MRKTHYVVCVYDTADGLKSIHAVEIFDTTNKERAYAVLGDYLEKHPECVKAYIDERN